MNTYFEKSTELFGSTCRPAELGLTNFMDFFKGQELDTNLCWLNCCIGREAQFKYGKCALKHNLIPEHLYFACAHLYISD